MSQPRGVSEDLVSELSADPDMIELVEMFVQELPGKAEALERSLAEGDWDSLVFPPSRKGPPASNRTPGMAMPSRTSARTWASLRICVATLAPPASYPPGTGIAGGVKPSRATGAL